ncbi:hypothetical protein R4J70_17565 [Pseudomonas aeruginosa]|uniref:hypothetical protein n=1 Tax=Pseudomonas aeruginosa TaxID=287 RepID=UPI0022ACD8A0|nr:hypothetical protein [Pseudomonas aeruginosa]MDV7781788.1 hypothetical protein [Pseudomonas aeruginosa]HCT8041671.1 hypothetical protein [Pseudomonas aeruginosa]
MITILNNIMASNRFTPVDVNLPNQYFEFSLYKAESRHREEYFLTVQLDNNSDQALKNFLDNTAQEIFEEIQSTGKVELYFEKNCTMLICLESHGLNHDLVLTSKTIAWFCWTARMGMEKQQYSTPLNWPLLVAFAG